MKGNSSHSFVGLHLATLATLAVIVTVPLFALSVVHADTRLDLSSGLSYINQQDLQSSQAVGSSGTVSGARAGWLTTIGAGWQRLAADGGYSLAAQAALDRGLGAARDIGSFDLEGAWMEALSRDWLSRVNLVFSTYRDEDQPAYNNQTRGVGLTLGWFGAQNAGLDLDLAWRHEQYQDNPDGGYDGERLTLGGRYYFAHLRDQPYWSVAVQWGRFEAPEMAGYSYESRRLSLGYHDWRWRDLQASLQLAWRNNRYEQTSASALMDGGMGGGMGGFVVGEQSDAQRDDYLTANLDLSYPLAGQWRLSSRLGAGRYRSNLAQNRPLRNAYLGIGYRF